MTQPPRPTSKSRHPPPRALHNPHKSNRLPTSKIRTHCFQKASPVPPRYHRGHVPGTYISFPFCAQKCTYCNFASGVFPRELETRYLDALRAEIADQQWQWVPETVYIGGGTPSRLAATDLSGLLATIPGFPWREATIEAAPGDLSKERAEAWQQAGINRVSFGVQSFITRELAQTGRR